jgi:hypothetical protein
MTKYCEDGTTFLKKAEFTPLHDWKTEYEDPSGKHKLRFFEILVADSDEQEIVFGVLNAKESLNFPLTQDEMFRMLKEVHNVTRIEALKALNRTAKGDPCYPDWLLWDYYCVYTPEIRKNLAFSADFMNFKELMHFISTRTPQQIGHAEIADHTNFARHKQATVPAPAIMVQPEKKKKASPAREPEAKKQKVAEEEEDEEPLSLRREKKLEEVSKEAEEPPKKKAEEAPKKKAEEPPKKKAEEPPKKKIEEPPPKKEKEKPAPAKKVEEPAKKTKVEATKKGATQQMRKYQPRMIPQIFARWEYWQDEDNEQETYATLSEKYGRSIETAPRLDFIFEDGEVTNDQQLKFFCLLASFEAMFCPFTPEVSKAYHKAPDAYAFPQFVYEYHREMAKPPTPRLKVDAIDEEVTDAVQGKNVWERYKTICVIAQKAMNAQLEALKEWEIEEGPNIELFRTGLSYEEIADAIGERPWIYLPILTAYYARRPLDLESAERGPPQFFTMDSIVLRYWMACKSRVPAPVEEVKTAPKKSFAASFKTVKFSDNE